MENKFLTKQYIANIVATDFLRKKGIDSQSKVMKQFQKSEISRYKKYSVIGIVIVLPEKAEDVIDFSDINISSNSAHTICTATVTNNGVRTYMFVEVVWHRMNRFQ